MNFQKTTLAVIFAGLFSSAMAFEVPSEPFAADTAVAMLLRLDTLERGLADDSGPGQRHGRVQGCRITGGRFGNALYFNGEGDFVDAGGRKSEPSFWTPGEGDFTVELWMRSSNSRNRMQLINKKCSADATDPGFMISLFGGQPVALLADGLNGVLIKHPARVTDGQWHHIALVVRHGKSAALYVDGVASEEVPITGLIDFTNSARPIRIGDRKYKTDDCYEGELDEIRISMVARYGK